MSALAVDVLTIFPHMFPGPLGDSITGRALAAGIVQLRAIDIRAFATDRQRTVDDYPYGAGPGMAMRPAPIVDSIESLRAAEAHVSLMTPGAPRSGQPLAHELARA